MKETGAYRPTPQQRRNAVLTIVLSVGIGLIVLYIFHARIEEIQATAPRSPETAITEVLRLLRYLLTGGVMIALALGLYLIRVALRTIRSEQFPPPGTWMLRQTPLRIGPTAGRRGRLILAMGLIVILVGLSFGVFFSVKYRQFAASLNAHPLPDQAIRRHVPPKP